LSCLVIAEALALPHYTHAVFLHHPYKARVALATWPKGVRLRLFCFTSLHNLLRNFRALAGLGKEPLTGHYAEFHQGCLNRRQPIPFAKDPVVVIETFDSPREILVGIPQDCLLKQQEKFLLFGRRHGGPRDRYLFDESPG